MVSPPLGGGRASKGPTLAGSGTAVLVDVDVEAVRASSNVGICSTGAAGAAPPAGMLLIHKVEGATSLRGVSDALVAGTDEGADNSSNKDSKGSGFGT